MSASLDLHGLPTDFSERLYSMYPTSIVESIVAAMQYEDATLFRLHGLKHHPDNTLMQLHADGLHPHAIDWLDDLYLLPDDERSTLTEHPFTIGGGLYIQNPSSMMAPLALAPEAGEEIMEMCAAPGGKTLLLADAMDNQGRIAAIESVRGRFFKLKHLMQVYGAELVQCYNTDARNLWRKVAGRFDRILLDAPCSSEARIRPHQPGSWAYWSPKKIKEAARKQRGLIRAAFDCLKPGGTMVYCTCTFAPEENELVVNHLLKHHGEEVHIEPVSLPCPSQRPGITEWQGKSLHPDLRHAIRIIPNGLMHAFFLCKLKKGPA